MTGVRLAIAAEPIHMGTMDLLDELRRLVPRHLKERRTETAIPGMVIVSSPAVTKPGPALYDPAFFLAVQGRKRLMVGERVVEYDTANCLTVSLDLPVMAEIVEASPECPYLAIGLKLDRAAIASLVLELATESDEAVAALLVMPVTQALLDPMVRLVRLLDSPDDIPILAPLVERELHYRLLTGPQGPLLRQIALKDSRLSRISRAIDWIRGHYTAQVRVEDLAEIAGMSPSSFHRHFKAATAMSPLQYQKQIRLQEARHLLLAQSMSAGGVAFAVGYESPSQFSREYTRVFGLPPTRDVARLRETPVAPAEV